VGRARVQIDAVDPDSDRTQITNGVVFVKITVHPENTIAPKDPQPLDVEALGGRHSLFDKDLGQLAAIGHEKHHSGRSFFFLKSMETVARNISVDRELPI
jgi:hypothetical protein